MKKAAVTGEKTAEFVEAPDPQPKEDWVVVKVHTAPMCTEYKAFLGGWETGYLGHEAAGEVVAVAQPGLVKEGDRVVVMPMYACGACPLCVSGDFIHCESSENVEGFTGSREGEATMAQYLLKPAWQLPVIPEDLSYDQASLACCALGPSFGAFDRMGVDLFDTVLITGAGPVGLGAVVNASFRGARVFVAEFQPYRVEKAKQLGADVVFDPREPDVVQQIKELTGGRGVDKSLDCSGTVPAQRLCIDATRRRGQVTYIGECGDDLPIKVSPDLIRKGLTIHGSWHYNLNLFPKIMQVIRRSSAVKDLVTHTFPMSDIQAAMELSASQQCGKILLHPWD